MAYSIVTLPDGGVGPEILNGSLSLLEIISNKCSSNYQIEHHESGGASIDTFDEPLAEKTLNTYKRADTILLGVIGGLKWTNLNNRLEQGLLRLRKSLDLSVSIRPVTVVKGASFLSPLEEKRVEGTDLVIARELASGIYLGKPRHFNSHEALDSLTYMREEIERIVHVAFKLAASRQGEPTSVGKENALVSSKLWREVVGEVGQLYSEVTADHLLVDACSMHLAINPGQFDVIIYESLFGDVLSDETSMIPGPFDLSPSASFNNDGSRSCEPIYGSTLDIADKNVANPFGMILSLAMCLRENLSQPDVAGELEQHAYSMIEHGQTTADLDGELNITDIFEILPQKLNH